MQHAYSVEQRGLVPELRGIIVQARKTIYEQHRLHLGLFGSDPGKAAWARQRLQASDFTRLWLDGPAWRKQILQGSNQTSLDASADRTWLARLT